MFETSSCIFFAIQDNSARGRRVSKGSGKGRDKTKSKEPKEVCAIARLIVMHALHWKLLDGSWLSFARELSQFLFSFLVKVTGEMLKAQALTSLRKNIANAHASIIQLKPLEYGAQDWDT